MGIKIKDNRIKVSTEGPKKISLSPYNIKYLIGNNRNHNILKYKFNDEKEFKTIIDPKNSAKFFLKDKIEPKSNWETTISFNNTND